MVELVGDPRAERERGAFLAFDDVEARLVEAVRTTWRMEDREAGWLKVKSAWPKVLRHNWFGDYPNTDPDDAPELEPLSRRQIAEMEEALAWVMAAGDEDRRLIGLALRAKAAGAKRVPWTGLLKPMGVRHGAHGLRKRYSRAMVLVCEAANAEVPKRASSRG